VDWEIDTLEVCDPDSDGFEFFDLLLAEDQIVGDLAGVSVTYHETLTDAELDDNAIADAEITTPGWQYANIDVWTQIIYARIETNATTGCYDTVALTLQVNPTPQINFVPDDLEVCDDSFPDGLVTVDLTQQEPNILGGVPSDDVVISYYHNQDDAWAEEFPIFTPEAYINSVNPETIWVRVEYEATNCASVVHFDIIVNPLPVVETPTALEACDDIDDGEDNNGYVQSFMLSDKDAEILNGQAATVSYHYTQEDALEGTNALSSPFENTIPSVQTLWVRVTFDSSGCFAITTLDVVVNPLPTPVSPAPLEACDDDANGFADFDLDIDLITEIQNGEAGVVITFHETATDAANNVAAITSPYTSISADTQTIWARDTYIATGCYRVVPIQLIANPSPQPNQPTDYEVCDAEPDLYDGFAEFDLSIKDEEILEGIEDTTALVLTYHLTQEDADTGAEPIDTSELFTNTVNPQTIYIRLENSITGCYNTEHFDLIVNPNPSILAEPIALQVCDDNYDEVVGFDLQSAVLDILNGQDDAVFIVYFFETFAQAEEGDLTYLLPNPYYNTSNVQTIHVRIENTNTGCFALTTLDLKVLPIPNANLAPAPIELCDNADDGDALNGFVQTFDLSTAVADILNGQFDTSLVFYDTYEAAQLEDVTHVIDHTILYTNTTAHYQSIWAVVTDNDSALTCKAIVKLTLIVNPLPVLDTDFINYAFCEDDNDGSYLADLSDMDGFVLDDYADLDMVSITYHTGLTDALNGDNPRPDSILITSDIVLWARVENIETGCVSVSPAINIHIGQLPTVGAVNDLVQCDDNTDSDNTNGLGVSFDLASQSFAAADGQTDVTVSYYLVQDDALYNANPIILDAPFINTVNPQTIWVRVVNTSGCAVFTSFELTVNDPPHFGEVTNPTVCLENIPDPIASIGIPLLNTDTVLHIPLDRSVG